MTLQRLIVTFRSGELVVHALYRCDEGGGANPGTKGRTREVAELARAGLEQALEALRAGPSV